MFESSLEHEPCVVQHVPLHMKEKYTACNPSIVQRLDPENGHILLCRTVNYECNVRGEYSQPNGDKSVHTETFWFEMDKKGDVKHQTVIEDRTIQSKQRWASHVCDLEDLRIVMIPDNQQHETFWATGTSLQHRNDGTVQMVLVPLHRVLLPDGRAKTVYFDRVLGLEIDSAPMDMRQKCEKNWLPLWDTVHNVPKWVYGIDKGRVQFAQVATDQSKLFREFLISFHDHKSMAFKSLKSQEDYFARECKRFPFLRMYKETSIFKTTIPQTLVLTLKNTKEIEEKEDGKQPLVDLQLEPELRGSGSPVLWNADKNEWIYPVHRYVRFSNEHMRRRYYTRMIIYNGDTHAIVAVSNPFHLQDNTIEFVSGFAQGKSSDEFIMTWGENDKRAFEYRFTRETIVSWFS